MPLEIDFDFSNDETLRCKGAENTDKATQKGEYFGNFVANGQRWAIVLWDGEDDPDLYKADMLLVIEERWIPLR